MLLGPVPSPTEDAVAGIAEATRELIAGPGRRLGRDTGFRIDIKIVRRRICGLDVLRRIGTDGCATDQSRDGSEVRVRHEPGHQAEPTDLDLREGSEELPDPRYRHVGGERLHRGLQAALSGQLGREFVELGPDLREPLDRRFDLRLPLVPVHDVREALLVLLVVVPQEREGRRQGHDGADRPGREGQ